MDEARAERRSPASKVTGRKNMLGSPHSPGLLSRQLVSVKIAEVLLAARLKVHAWVPLRPNTGIGLDSGYGPPVPLLRFGCWRRRGPRMSFWRVFRLVSTMLILGRSRSVFGADPESSK